MPNQIAFYPQSSGGAGSVTLISTQVASGSVSSLTFTVPQTFTNLSLIGVCSGVTSQGNVAIQLNSDTGANYDTQFIVGVGNGLSASALAAQTQGFLGNMSGPGFTSTVEATIPAYAKTTFAKSIQAENIQAAASNVMTRIVAGIIWHSTAAITSITVIAVSAGNFTAGSTFSLYGLQ